jgi:hypothetical protein
VKGTAEERATFTTEIETRVHEVVREFQEMELTQMRKGEIKARAKLAEARKDFTAKRDAMKEALAGAKNASSAAWTDVRGGVESAWEELSTAFEQARTHLSDGEGAEDAPKSSQRA